MNQQQQQRRIRRRNKAADDGAPSSSSFAPLLVVLLFCNLLLVAHAQEGPNFDLQVPLFERPKGRRGTFRHDFCNLSLQVVEGKIALEDALQGVDLNILLADGAFVNFDYNTTTDNNGTTTIIKESVRLNERYAGLVPDILDTICESARCRWRNSYFPIFYSDDLQGRTFNELLTWSVDTYDMNADWWMRSIDRLVSGASYPEKWYDGSIIMVQKKNKEGSQQDEFNPWGWLAPFETSVWYLVLATMLLSSLVYWFLEWLNPDSDGTGGDDDILEPSHIVWMNATSFAGQFEFNPQTGPARLFTFSIAVWSLLMTSAYTANLASFLVIRNNAHIRIDTLEQAVSLERTMCVWQSSQTDLTVSTDFAAYAADSGKLVRTNHNKGVFEGLNNGDCEIAITEVSSWAAFQNDYTVNEKCDLEVTGAIYKVVPASFTIKSDASNLCTSLLRDVLNVHMFKMEFNGDMEDLWEKYQEEIDTAKCGGGGTLKKNNRWRKLAANGQITTRRRRGTFNLPKASRQLKTTTGATTTEAAAAGAAAPTTTTTTATKLSLINMGGVFLLHGILSALSIVLALIPWFYNRYFQKESSSSSSTSKAEETSSVENTSLTPLDLAAALDRQPSSRRRLLRTRSFDSAQRARYADVLDLRKEINTRFTQVNDRLESLLLLLEQRRPPARR